MGPLLGSCADASTAFAEHLDDDETRVRDPLGSVALLVAAAMLAWGAVTARRSKSLSPEIRNARYRSEPAIRGWGDASAQFVAQGRYSTWYSVNSPTGLPAICA